MKGIAENNTKEDEYQLSTIEKGSLRAQKTQARNEDARANAAATADVDES